MDFRKAYQQAIECEGFQADQAQELAVEQLGIVYSNLVKNNSEASGLQKLWRLIKGHSEYNVAYRGCYLWGDVGRGKTWLMDLFYQSLPFKEKSRLHFHEFMQQIHLRLKTLDGQRDPLITVAGEISATTSCICLDEFHVSDITDAMLLYGLLDALYKKGTSLLMTSNVHPDELYKNGLQRSRFIPAIELIKKQSLVLQMTGTIDYRLMQPLKNFNYLAPLTPETDTLLESRFRGLAKGEISTDEFMIVNNRKVNYLMLAENIAWFDFKELCGGPRAATDYLYLAGNFDFVIVSNVFRMDDSYDDIAKRFINLVDALYDRQVGIILSATGLPDELYSGKRFREEIRRTVSRLEEIRSRTYEGLDRSVLLDRNSLLSSR